MNYSAELRFVLTISYEEIFVVTNRTIRTLKPIKKKIFIAILATRRFAEKKEKKKKRRKLIKYSEISVSICFRV